ncbi:DEAD-box ATP-dependent RNA helicase 50-like [Hordeum vulgare subsp. vulgare]|uniref:DEAD-box ATP-dependent RNA helicase 50 n=1 Tax=Hordeum vulgare subsp. vulgare TaxID=112509 RepID=A0A8I6YBN9_HORVV|nr:DEAD-box ATP-dependent RNA helicase 50-like [Hordeum vulgare subsp. vulgare]
MDVAGAQARALPLLLGRPAASLRCTISFSCGSARRSWAAAATTADGEDGGRGYERVAMDTPGAYRLVDRSTGKSVIVWGGVDDGEDPSVPSPAVLSRVTADRSASKGAANGGSSAGVGSFGRLKAQKVQALARRSAAQLKREGTSSRTSIAQRNEPPSADSDEEGNNSGRRKFVPDPARRAKPNGDSRDARTSAVRSLNSVLRQYKGDDDSDFSDEEPASGPKVWGKVADVTSYRREDRKQKVPLDSGFFSRRSFKEIGCGDEILGALRTFGFPQPSHIQAMAYAPVLEGRSCIIADQSGSGKTLAYLCPIVQNLRKEEAMGIHKPSPRNPRVVILTPTAELSSQVLQNCRSISKSGVPFRSMVATGGFRQKTQLESLDQELDVLIATPGRFLYLLQEGFVQLNNLRCAVFDEVDILFSEEGFEQVLHQLITIAPVTTQYLFVTATLPLDIYNKVVETFPDCEVLMGPSVHRTSARLEEILVDCSGNDNDEKNPETAFSNKRTALLKIIEESPVRKTIVFCNKIETCRKVENVLTRLDRKATQIKVLPFHAALDQAKRIANMKEFLKKQTTDSMFLVCTDRASRGIDFTNVNHVVLFDYPRDPSEYVRRVGRTARGASGDGKAFVFAVGKQVSLARRVMERNLKGHPLHDVPCF